MEDEFEDLGVLQYRVEEGVEVGFFDLFDGEAGGGEEKGSGVARRDDVGVGGVERGVEGVEGAEEDGFDALNDLPLGNEDPTTPLRYPIEPMPIPRIEGMEELLKMLDKVVEEGGEGERDEEMDLLQLLDTVGGGEGGERVEESLRIPVSPMVVDEKEDGEGGGGEEVEVWKSVEVKRFMERRAKEEELRIGWDEGADALGEWMEAGFGGGGSGGFETDEIPLPP